MPKIIVVAVAMTKAAVAIAVDVCIYIIYTYKWLRGPGCFGMQPLTGLFGPARSRTRFGPPCYVDLRLFAVFTPKGMSRNTVNYGASDLGAPG